jgi:hypothetical protein
MLLLGDCIDRYGIAPQEIQNVMDELAGGLESVDEIENACAIRGQLLEFALKHVSEGHVAALGHMENLASDLYWLERYDESIQLLERVWHFRIRDLGRRDPVTLETQNELVTVLVRGRQFEKGIDLAADLYDYYQDCFGAQDERTASALEQLTNARLWSEKDKSQGG